MRNKNKPNKDILEYQPNAVEIEERPTSGRIRWTLYLIIFFIISIITWAAVGKVDRVVTASGKLITTTPKIVIQPLKTSIIRSIHVNIGDFVKKGTLLVTLDPTFTDADFAQLEKRLFSTTVQLRRIDAELNHTTFSASIDEGEDGYLQELLFKQRHETFLQKERLTNEKISALSLKQEKNLIDQKGGEKQNRILREIESINSRNPQTDDGYKLKVLAAQKDRLQSKTLTERLRAEYSILAEEMQQVRTEHALWVHEREMKLLELFINLRNEKDKLSEEINKAKRMSELVFLKAQEDSVVLDIAEVLVGSVTRQAEPIITLVPVNVPLEAEINIKGKDIGRVRVGDLTRIKLDAFPFQKHGTLKGLVRVISEDSYQEKASSTNFTPSPVFYKTRVTIESYELRDIPDSFRLIPGMRITTEIKIGKRSIISYFLYPVIRALDQSIREP